MLLVLLGCGPDAQAWRSPAADVTLSSDELAFAAVAPGGRAGAALIVTNGGDAAVTLVTRTVAPFSVDRATLDVGAGGSATLTVSFAPEAWEDVTGHLHVGVAAVALTGLVQRDGDGDGQDTRAAGGTDCDDSDAAIHTGAEDACGDSVDADCDPTGDDDCDGDGAPAVVDCDDDDSSRSPLATETEDGVDEDCDGLIDEHLAAAGDLVMTELAPQAPAWFEVCSRSTRTVALDGIVLWTAAGPATFPSGSLAPEACVEVCASSVADCALTAEFEIDPLADTLTLAAGATVLDAVSIGADWGWQAGWVWSVDPAFATSDANNGASAWCRTRGTPGEANPACSDAL